MTYFQLEALAREFMLTPFASRKQEIIQKIVKEDGEDGLALLANLTGYTKRYLAWYGQLTRARRARSRARRGKDPSLAWPRVRAEEAARIARMLAGVGARVWRDDLGATDCLHILEVWVRLIGALRACLPL